MLKLMVKLLLLSLVTVPPQSVVQEQDGQWYVVPARMERTAELPAIASPREDFAAYEVIEPMRGVRVTSENPGGPIRVVVPFAPGSAVVSERTEARLRELGKRYPKVRVEGHTDSRGGAKANYRLSRKRANAVANILRAEGATVTTIGYGETQPLCREATEDCNARNRRAVVRAKETKQ